MLLGTVVLAAPKLPEVAAQGEGAFLSILNGVLPRPLTVVLVLAIIVAQYLCGLATVTSASRMAFAFVATVGSILKGSSLGLPPATLTTSGNLGSSSSFYPVHASYPSLCDDHSRVYDLPLCFIRAADHLGCLGLRTDVDRDGPVNLGHWYRPLAVLSAIGCVGLIMLGMQPPNQRSLGLYRFYSGAHRCMVQLRT